VPVAEISDSKYDYNLNLPRYIDSTEPEDLQDIDGHLRGGIPNRDLSALDLIAAGGAVVPPQSYEVRSNGKQDAIATRPQPRVREEDCVGCRLCYNVCPVENCISMVEEPSGRPSVTWSEICRDEPEITADWEAMQRYREKHGIHIH